MRILKKLAAISLLLLFLFNLAGYHLFYAYLQNKADKRTERSIDEERYNKETLLTITVPLSLPYQATNTAYERATGEVTIHGTTYKYVKRKISDGNLVLVCLPDLDRMQLRQKKSEVFKDLNGLTGTQESKDPHGVKQNIFSGLGEYDVCNIHRLAKVSSLTPSPSQLQPDVRLSLFPHDTPEQPPENLA